MRKSNVQTRMAGQKIHMSRLELYYTSETQSPMQCISFFYMAPTNPVNNPPRGIKLKRICQSIRTSC